MSSNMMHCNIVMSDVLSNVICFKLPALPALKVETITSELQKSFLEEWFWAIYGVDALHTKVVAYALFILIINEVWGFLISS